MNLRDDEIETNSSILQNSSLGGHSRNMKPPNFYSQKFVDSSVFPPSPLLHTNTAVTIASNSTHSPLKATNKSNQMNESLVDHSSQPKSSKNFIQAARKRKSVIYFATPKTE